MSNETILRRLAREAIQAGKMPSCSPERLWGGAGVGIRCAICGSTVGRDEVEFELEFRLDVDRGQGNFHVHARCFAAWELERQDLPMARVPANELTHSVASVTSGIHSLLGGEESATITDRERGTACKRESA
jgi:hypothetical protein